MVAFAGILPIEPREPSDTDDNKEDQEHDDEEPPKSAWALNTWVTPPRWKSTAMATPLKRVRFHEA